MSHGFLAELLRCALPAVGLLLALTLQGCETQHDMMVRLSCKWTPGLILEGCQADTYEQCVNRCENCVDSSGRANDCNQLKCAAYCAKRNGGSCSSTYKTLCTEAVQILKNGSSAQWCNVDCSAGPRASMPSLLPLFLAMLTAFWAMNPFFDFERQVKEERELREPVPGRGWFNIVLVAVLGLVSISLQGCAQTCPKTPSLMMPVDWARFDQNAGCTPGWTPLAGASCASEVPVLFAKKGIYINDDNDLNILKAQVANRDYNCLLRKPGPGGYCQRWTYYYSMCAYQKYGICRCVLESTDTRFCAQWSCIYISAAQQYSRVYHTDNGDVVADDDFGSNGLTLDMNTFYDILQAQGSQNVLQMNATDALINLHANSWITYNFQNSCISRRYVLDPSIIDCNYWRVINTTSTLCTCYNQNMSAGYCNKWNCEDRTLDEFAVLFFGMHSYSDLAHGNNIKYFECLRGIETSPNTSQCLTWRSDSYSFNQVQTGNCQSGLSNGANPYDKWACNEFTMNRIQYTDAWGLRLGFLICHWLWILPFSVFFLGVQFMFLETRRKEHHRTLCALCCDLCICAVFVAILHFLIWAIGFLRAEAYGTRAPLWPVAGLSIMIYPAWLLGILFVILVPSTEEAKGSVATLFTIGIMLCISFIWTTGIIIPCILLGPCCICGFCKVCSLCVYSSKNNFFGVPQVQSQLQSKCEEVAYDEDQAQASDVGRGQVDNAVTTEDCGQA